MDDRRTSERLLVAPESLERITPDPAIIRVVHCCSDAPGETPGRADANPADTEKEDRTEPMKLSFLALLAERDPAVQTRLNRRITPVLELDEFSDEARPTDPMTMTAKFSG